MRRCAGGLAAVLGCWGGSTAWSRPVAAFGRRWAGPKEVPQGLMYHPNFVTASEEQELLQVIDGPGTACRCS